MPYIYYVLLVPTTILAAMLLTVLLHELGHAIPLLLLSKGTVGIYIGSNGDARQSIHLRLGRLEVFCTYNPLLWRYGNCRPPAEPFSIFAQIVYTLTGPLVSAASTIACWFLLSQHEEEGMVKFFIECMLFFSFITTLFTLVPRGNAAYTTEGVSYGNDGYEIVGLLSRSMTPKAIVQIEQDLANEQYQRAADGVDQRFALGKKSRRIYRLGIYAHIQLKNYTRALELTQLLSARYTPDKNDLYQLGYIHTFLKNFDLAQQYYQEALDKAPNDPYALNGKGYILALRGHHAEAINCLDKAIQASHDFAHAYCNRGYSKINSDQLESGLQDINHSLKLDNKNAYGYRNLGIYYRLNNEWEQAEGLFKKAKELDPDMDGIDGYLREMEQLRS